MKVEIESVESLYPFVLTEDQEHLRREISEFAAREIAPNVMAWDEASEFPLDVIKKLGAMGLLGVIFPPEYGGAGLGYVDYVLAIEELSAVDGSIGLTIAARAKTPTAVAHHPLHAESATPCRQRIVADVDCAARLHLRSEQADDAGLDGRGHPAP